jgi:hypothetical protein
MISGEACRLWRSSLCSLLQPPAALFSNTCCSLSFGDQVPQSHETKRIDSRNKVNLCKKRRKWKQKVLPVNYTGGCNGKGKTVPVLSLSTMPWRCVEEWRCRSMHSLTSALDGGEWLASRPGRFTPGKEPQLPMK